MPRPATGHGIEKQRRTQGTGALFTRTDSAGREAWYGKWRVNGSQVKRKLGPVKTKTQPNGLTARQAEATLRKVMADLTGQELERLKVATVSTKPSISRVLEAYLADHDDLKQRTTVHDYRGVCANWFEPFFGDRPLDRITEEHVRDSGI
jgi:hypothetical protein